MKIISLNVWCGIKYESLKIFLEQQLANTDIFCFQEVRNGKYLNQAEQERERINLFNEIKNLLFDFTGYFAEMAPGVGMASFVRKNINVERVESIQILSAEDVKSLKMLNGDNYYPRIMQSIYLKDRNLVVYNFHGVPGNFKKDTPERNLQTERLLEIFNANNRSQIIVGDFNLDIKTEAISKLDNQFRNLIKEGKFKTTRNTNYNNLALLPFADYAFVSRDIEVASFEVLPDEVSDHLALLLEFK